MATWITHLRVAERLLEQRPELEERSFLMGNMAPDSGARGGFWPIFALLRLFMDFKLICLHCPRKAASVLYISDTLQKLFHIV